MDKESVLLNSGLVAQDQLSTNFAFVRHCHSEKVSYILKANTALAGTSSSIMVVVHLIPVVKILLTHFAPEDTLVGYFFGHFESFKILPQVPCKTFCNRPSSSNKVSFLFCIFASPFIF